MPQDSDDERAARSFTKQKIGLGLALVVPCLVIALSLYAIIEGKPRATADALGRVPPSPDGGEPVPRDGGARDGTAIFDPPEAMLPPLYEDGGPRLLEKTQPALPLVSENADSGAEALPGSDDADDFGRANDGESPSRSPAPKPSPKRFATVQLAALGSCSTESVDGLSRQIIEQARCIRPSEFTVLPKRANLLLAPHVYPYLDASARDHLLKALGSRGGSTMTVNSALRTVAQQYLVWHWAASKSCGVQLATAPGESNHEVGLALDIEEAAKWRPALEAQEFRWLGASDRVHFDFKGDATPRRTATDVLAFQKLWNKNHPEDPLPESGRYSPAMEQRLKKSPALGFALGPTCRPPSATRASAH